MLDSVATYAVKEGLLDTVADRLYLRSPWTLCVISCHDNGLIAEPDLPSQSSSLA
jgi:hypothetical protein